MNGADILCDTLLAHDVDVCFTNPGTSEMHFVAALDKKEGMRCVLGLFEGVVTGAADGYGRMADKPAATLLHLGPGLANGLASLHNARRAETPILNIVGDHAVGHLQHDSPLTSDIDSLARPMSSMVRRVRSADEVSTATVEAIEATRAGAGAIATLILPADASWSPAPPTVRRARLPQRTAVCDNALKHAADLLRNGKSTLLLLGGKALRSGALAAADRIAQVTGAELMAPTANARIERGRGRVAIDRLPFNVDQAVQRMAGFKQVILVGAPSPSIFFAYPGKPGTPLADGCEVFALTRASDDLQQALESLADLLGAQALQARQESGEPKLALPSGAVDEFSGTTVIQTIAALAPDNAIICDESVSAGRLMYGALSQAAPHDYLQLTGGAIGFGIPVAAGAAIACPDRKLILMQADGSGMYNIQGLWTHAREQLDIVTVIFANHSYAVLHNELRMVGAGEAGRNARRMLDIVDPKFNWVSMADAAGIEAARVADLDTFIDVFKTALARKGPFLIEVSL